MAQLDEHVDDDIQKEVGDRVGNLNRFVAARRRWWNILLVSLAPNVVSSRRLGVLTPPQLCLNHDG